MSLASSRSRRSNAGANMSKLLDQEEALNEDDFYKTHYGGFEEIANDSDFDSANSSDSENVIDSDFDIDETADQPAPEDEEAVEKELKAEERESKTKRSVYKDPKAKGASSAAAKKRVLTKKRSSPAKKEQPTTTITATTATTSSSSASSSPTHFSTFGEPPAKKAHLTGPSTSKAALKSDHSDDGGGGGGSGFDYRDYSGTVSRSLRKSTQNHSAAIREMLDERQRESKKRKESAKKNVHELRPLTQKELLKEAQKTEIENTRWLENYKLIEIERVNKAKAAKAKKDVPVIRYHSYLETEEVDGEEEEEDADYEDAENEEEKGKQRKTRSVSRTVITFPSEESFRRHFPACKSKEQSQLEVVVVTGGSLTKITPTGKAPAAVAGPSTSAAAAAATGEQLTTIKPDPLASKENTAAAEQANKSNNPDGTKPSEKSGPFSLLRTVKLPSKGLDGGSRVTCVITGRPARYFDPLTQQPYADVSAFKLLRYYYGVYLRETFPEQKDRPEMVEFLRQNTDQARQMTVSGARTTTIKVLPKAAAAAAMVMGAGTSKLTIQTAPAGVGVSAAHQASSPAAAAALYQIQHPQTVIAPGSSSGSSGGATTTTYQLTRATPQQVLQLQQLPGGSGGGGRPGGGGGSTTFTILNHPIAGVVGGSGGGGSAVSTAVTPLHLINTGGGAGGGGSVYLFSIPNSAAHRGNPMLRPAQLVSTGQPGQFVALQAQPKK